MKEKKSLEMYDKMPVSKAVFQNALPAVIAMLMVLIYNLADTFFIGQTNDAYQVAAVSLATPVFLLFMALGTIFGIGGTSVISRAFGEGRKEYARKVSAFCMWGSVIVGCVLTVCILVFMDPLLSLIGASAQTWEYTRTYLIIVSISGPFALLSSCFSNVLRAEGQAGKAMVGQILGNVLNMSLDALLIVGFHWDIVGCALATLIGEFAGAVYYIYYLKKGNSQLSIKWKDASMKEGVLKGVLSIGIPASLGSLLMSVSSIVMNSMMAGFGDMAVAAAGVAMKIVMITGMISMGVGQGIQPLLGFSVGRKDGARFGKTMRFSLIFATIIGCVMTMLCYLFDREIVGAFLTDGQAISYAVSFSRIMICSGPIFGIFYVLTNAIQAMGAGTASLIINVSRQGIIYIPSLFIMRAILGVTGLAWAQPIADVISFGLALVLYMKVRREIMGREDSEPRGKMEQAVAN